MPMHDDEALMQEALQAYQEHKAKQKAVSLFDKGGAIRDLADKATAGIGGLVKGATFGLAPINYPGMEQTMDEQADATAAGGVAGGLVAGGPVVKGAKAVLGAGRGALGGLGEAVAVKALDAGVPGAGKAIQLMQLIRGAKAVAPAAQVESAAIEAALADSAIASRTESGLESLVKPPVSAKPKIDPFQVRKSWAK